MAVRVVVFDVGEALAPPSPPGLHAIRIRRRQHVRVESPEGKITIDSLDELSEVLERV